MTAVITDSTERQISVAWEDGTVRQLSATWLRDNIPAGRHRAEGQRTFDINELDPPSVVAARLDGAALAVDFADLTAEFPLDWIKEVSDGEPASGRVPGHRGGKDQRPDEFRRAS